MTQSLVLHNLTLNNLIFLDRVLHTPITNVEELKFDLIKQFEELDRDDSHVVIDSIGNLAEKELEDAPSEKSVADMSREPLKGLFRMSTPYLR